MPGVLAAIDERGQPEQLGHRQVTQRHYIKQSVIDASLGGDVHATAKVPPVGYRQGVDGSLLGGLVVQADAHAGVAVVHRGAQRGHQKCGTAAQRFARLIDHVIDQAAKSAAGDV